MDSRPAFERIGPPPVQWGLTLCWRKRCVAPAVLTIDGWPYCLDHGDDEIERAIAFELNPAVVRSSFPGLDE